MKSNAGNSSLERIIGLNIGASTESRRWSELNFFELAKRLSPKGFAIRFLLGPQEAFLVKATRKVCRQNNWDFSLHRQVETLIKAVSECCLLISNDTGPGHLAAALDIPVITLFSTGSPDNVRPLEKPQNGSGIWMTSMGSASRRLKRPV